MAYEAMEFDAALAAVAGDDMALHAELREAFRDSVARQLDLMQRARCDGNWRVAALRLKGLASTFHAHSLIELADEALDGAPGEPGILRRIARFLAELEGNS